MDPYNVFAGKEGTGAAFILNGNKAADIFNNGVAQNIQQKRLEERQKQIALAERNALIDRNLSEINLADHWNAHDAEIQNEHKALIDEAVKLKVEGINAFTDPDWKSKLSALNNKAKFSGQLFNGLNDLQNEINNNPDKYSDESIAAAKAYYDPKKPLAQYTKEGALAPTLKPKYDESDVLKDLKPSTITQNDGDYKTTEVNTDATIEQLKSRLNTPAADFVLQHNYGVSPQIGAFGDIKEGAYPVDDAFVTSEVQKLLTTPGIEKELPSLGIESKDPTIAAQQLSQVIKAQNTGYNNALASWSSAINSKGDTAKEKVGTNFSQRMATARLKSSQNKEARAAKAEAEKEALTNPVVIGNSDSYTSVLKTGGKGVIKEKGSSLMSTNFENEEITIQPGRIIIPGKGTSEANTGAITMNAGGVRLVPVLTNVGEKFKDVEISDRQLKEIISGNHKSLKMHNLTFKPLVYGTRKTEDGEEAIAVPYDAISGNQKLKTKAFDKTYRQFNELINNQEFKDLTNAEKYEFLKQQFNLK